MKTINLESKTIRLRLVEEADAAFILSLRLDPKLNGYLSVVPSNVQKQIDWIRQYRCDEVAGRQFYFIIERIDRTSCGTVRVYDLKEDSFSWGSWILNEDKTRFAAVESAFLVYKFGFEVLGYKQSHFEVMKGNLGVIRFHERMGATRVGEDEEYIYLTITKEAVELKAGELRETLS